MVWKSWCKKGTHPENHDLSSLNASDESVLLIPGNKEKYDDDQVVEDKFINSSGVKDNSTDNAIVSHLLDELPNLELREDVMRQLKDARKIARYMQSTEDLVEYKIRKSMENGEFDRLEGRGRPIVMEENPYEDPTLRLPFKMLKDAGFAPYWIELGKAIDDEIEGTRMLFDKFLDGLRWRKSKRGFLDWNPELDFRRDKILDSCARKLEDANRKIDLYNRIVPIYWMQRKKVDEKHELSQMRKKWEELVVKPTL